MRACHPEQEGCVERDDVRIFYKVFGTGKPTVLLLPTWLIVHSRIWKAQVPYIARHCRVITFNGCGNGRSRRPASADAYSDQEFVADALAVMDATATRQAVLVAISAGACWTLLLAAKHTERVAGAVFIGPALPLGPGNPGRLMYSFNDVLDTDAGWTKYNHHYWLKDYRGFLEFFMPQIFTEPHSTKQTEDAVGWKLETTPEVLIAIMDVPSAVPI
jgi:pimeloyl-ACP methyl ester carboxylesterase